MRNAGAMKKILFALATLIIIFGCVEIALVALDYSGQPALSQQLADLRFSVAGELYGEFDPDRFWRLPNVEPRFSGDNPKVICLADSVTVMYEGKGYPDLLATAFSEAGYQKPVEVFNAGVPEYSTFQGWIYLQNELIQSHPDLVTIQYGWNDHWEARLGVPDHLVRFPNKEQLAKTERLLSWRTYRLLRSVVLSARFRPRVSVDKYKENLSNMVRMIRDANGKAILIRPVFLSKNQDWLPEHMKYDAATAQVAKELQAPYLDLQSRFENDATLFIEPEHDQVHFNWKGAQIISDAIVSYAIENKMMP